MKSRILFIIGLIGIIGGLTPSVWAVKTVFVEHGSEKQFKAGDPNGVVISSRGEMTLAWQAVTLLPTKNNDPSGPKTDPSWVVNALATDGDGTVYAATSGNGLIYRIASDKTTEIIYGLSDQHSDHVFSLATDLDGRLLAGTGGAAGALLRIRADGKIQTLWSDPAVKYIWSMVVGPSGRIYMGTGPEGKVITVNKEGKNPQVLFKAKEKNILALALAASGILYAGGDEYGLVYRIDPGTQKATVLYDTGQKETSSLVVGPRGDLYVATADTNAAKPGAKLILSDGDTSRPDEKEGGKIDKKVEIDNAESTEDPKETAAKKNSQVPAATQKSSKNRTSPPSPPPTTANEVFAISPDGYVRSLFKKEVVILSMDLSDDGHLLLGTGNEGKLLKLDVATQEAIVVHTAIPSVQVSAVLADDNTIWAGCANPAGLIAIKPDYQLEGHFLSEIIDAGQPSRWGKLQIEVELPAGATLKVATRSGNTSKPEKGGWEDWTESRSVHVDMPVTSPVGRFVQYRLEFVSTNGSATSLVRQVKLAHSIPNLPPEVSRVVVAPTSSSSKTGTTATPSKVMTISWTSRDANSDKMVYEIYLRQTGYQRWVKIAKDLKEMKARWDSVTVADGRYEFKVTASDKPSNPPGMALETSRISQAIVIDNTAPEITEMQYDLVDGTVKFRAKLRDSLSVIGSVSYTVNSSEKWEKVLPIDGIYDSRSEAVAFDFDLDEKGEHLLSIRFADAQENVTYRNLTITY